MLGLGFYVFFADTPYEKPNIMQVLIEIIGKITKFHIYEEYHNAFQFVALKERQ
jgi:hypothetical protein